VSARDDLSGEEIEILKGPPLEAQRAAPASAPAPDERRGYIGGSDAAAVCGLSPWKTAFQLYQEKRGEAPAPDLSAVERVYWGTVLEEVVAREYSRRTGRTVRRVNRTLYHPAYPFMAAHIDRLVVGYDRILECKTTDAARAGEWGEEGSEEIPRHYQPQPQHYLAVTGKAACDVAVLIGGNRMRIYTVRRDKEFIGLLIEAEREFWERVQAGEPPDPASPEEAAARWPRTLAGELEATPEEYAAANELLSVRTDQDKLKARDDELVLALEKRMADAADSLVFRGQRLCTWKPQVRRLLDGKALEAEHPEIAARFRKEIECRSFRLCLKS
jgi:putative phage-type endonuclease